MAEKTSFGPAAVGLEDFFPQDRGTKQLPSSLSDPLPDRLTRHIKIEGKRLGSREYGLRLGLTNQPLYYLSRPLSPLKPLAQLHGGRDADAPVVAVARFAPIGIGMEVRLENATNADSDTGWVHLVGAALGWSGVQRFTLHGRMLGWTQAREVDGVRAGSRAGFLVLQDAATGEVHALWERKSWDLKGKQGILMLPENLSIEDETIIVMTALVWDDGKGTIRRRYAQAAPGMGGGFYGPGSM